MLQWGRDQLIAGLLQKFRRLFLLWLQWGRDQLIAGLPETCPQEIECSTLQWGRDQLIAGLYPKIP